MTMIMALTIVICTIESKRDAFLSSCVSRGLIIKWGFATDGGKAIKK